MKKSYSAGGLVVNKYGQILVVNQYGNSWSLPKGHIEPGEDILTTAKREITEESGITDLKLIKELGSYERPRLGLDPRNNDISKVKNITLFLFVTDQLETKPQDLDNPEAIWLKPRKAVGRLTSKKDKEFLQKSLRLIDLKKLISFTP
ncbi:MAG: NUDIX domain-containing protein [Candidatus Gottesmanbacteria bacterium]